MPKEMILGWASFVILLVVIVCFGFLLFFDMATVSLAPGDGSGSGSGSGSGTGSGSGCTGVVAQVIARGNISVESDELDDPVVQDKLYELIDSVRQRPDVIGWAECTIPVGWKDDCPADECSVVFSSDTSIWIQPTKLGSSISCKDQEKGTLIVTG